LPNTPTCNRINNRTDISYGVYLYAWPIQILLIWYFAPISPWLVMLVATIGACLCGYASWILIEKPFLTLKRLERKSSNRDAEIELTRRDAGHVKPE
jgi:peptidoglycan/LPS O-acetylase OafA/YrhL